MSNNTYAILNNNVKMPLIGIGTYNIEEYSELKNTINNALEIGYKHIDTASYYNNEYEIGKVIKEKNIARDEIFITTKLWNNNHGYENALKAFNESLKKLNTDYIDLYLIHWPNISHKETWKALEKLYKDGYVKAIGVCNYKIHHLKEIINNFEIKPAVNQIELHPYLIQAETQEFCKNNNIKTEAWSPLMRGQVFSIDVLKHIAEKYNKTISQIVLRWDIQSGSATIPKSVKFERLKENFDIFDFTISDKDMKIISGLNLNKRISKDPDEVYNNPNIFD